MTQKGYADGATTKYYYDNCNNLAKTVDSRSGITTVYYYDLIGRLVGYHETSTTLDHRVTYSYDEQDRPKAMKETIDGHTKNYTYTYNKEDKLASMTVDGITLNYTYDALGRLATQTKVYNSTTVKTNNISYTGSGTATSGQISSYNGWEYTYNNKGYIASVTPDANTTNYTYNSAGFLIREDNQKLGKSFRWRYNNAGNITAKETYTYTTGTLGTPLETVTYTYGDTNWGDLLTAYNGQALTYNDMGSLKSDGTWNYYWKRGRELGSMVSGNTTWTYSYNGEGIRIGRTDGTNTYTYIYNGDKLTRVQYNSKLVRYNYDESGNPISLRYNNVLYFIDTNLQGDVVGIRQTSDNARVVNYVYDAYGKVCSITGTLKDTLGVHNVLRYRGYVYDNETGLYYLQSRYYNPEWGRFISADVFAATGQGFAGNNMFVYCGNNPVNHADPTGMLWKGIGDFFSKAWNGFKTLVKNTFGAGCSTTATIAEIEVPIIPDPAPITVKTGSTTTQTISQYGDSSKPISVYANGDVQDPIKSSSAGMYINIEDFNLDLCVALDDISVSGSLADGNITNSFGIKLNMSELKFGFEGATAIQWGNTTETTYTNVSLNGWAVVAAYFLITTGQPAQSPLFAH